MTDIEIAHNVEMKNISDIANKLNTLFYIPKNSFFHYILTNMR